MGSCLKALFLLSQSRVLAKSIVTAAFKPAFSITLNLCTHFALPNQVASISSCSVFALSDGWDRWVIVKSECCPSYSFQFHLMQLLRMWEEWKWLLRQNGARMALGPVPKRVFIPLWNLVGHCLHCLCLSHLQNFSQLLTSSAITPSGFSSQSFKLCHIPPRKQFQRPKNHILRSLTATAPLPSAALSEVITLLIPVTKQPWLKRLEGGSMLRVQGNRNILLTDRSINWLIRERWERDRQISNKKEIWIKERLVD